MEILSGFLVEERSLSYEQLCKRRTHVSCIRECLISAAPYVSLATVTALARREELLEFDLSSQPAGGEAREEVPAIKAGPGCPVSSSRLPTLWCWEAGCLHAVLPTLGCSSHDFADATGSLCPSCRWVGDGGQRWVPRSFAPGAITSPANAGASEVLGLGMQDGSGREPQRPSEVFPPHCGGAGLHGR